MDNRILSIECAEADAWRNMWDLASEGVQQKLGLDYKEFHGALCLRSHTPMAHFNMVLLLGIAAPIGAEELSQILQYYHGKGPRGFMVLAAEEMQGPAFLQLLEKAELKVIGSWERIARGSEPFFKDEVLEGSYQIREVEDATVEEWAQFVIGQYRFDAFLNWLRSYHAQPGWRHFCVWREGRIVAARSFYMNAEGMVWSGIEAPVPGFMTMDYNPDFAIWNHIIPDYLAHGAKGFVADIERVDDTRALPSYGQFLGPMGFTLQYRRLHYGKV